MDTSIVCGVDDSPDSAAALAVSDRLARELGARLVLAHVVEPEPYAHPAAFGGTDTRTMAAHDQMVAQEEAGARLLEQAAAASGIADAEFRVAIGFPAERLADIADEERATFIVVGSRGRGAFKSALLGSVSHRLVGIARRPVMIVPPGKADPQATAIRSRDLARHGS